MADWLAMWFKKYVVIAYGLVIQALGIALMYKSGAGSTPFSVMCDGLHRALGISESVASMGLSLICIAAAFLITRKYITVNTFITSFGFSILLDPAMIYVDMIMPEVLDLKLQIFFAVLSTVLVGASIGIILSANAGAGALECLQLGINDKTGIPFVVVVWAFNIFFVAAGWLMGGVVGITTILVAVIMGSVIKITTNLMAHSFVKWIGLDGMEVTN